MINWATLSECEKVSELLEEFRNFDVHLIPCEEQCCEIAKTAKNAKVVKFDPRLNEDRKFGCFSLKSERQKWITLN